jgi:hypothetical protein
LNILIIHRLHTDILSSYSCAIVLYSTLSYPKYYFEKKEQICSY